MNTSPDDSNEPNNNEEEPIFVMTLELENGKAEHIKIYSDSDPNELAYAFCKEHDLDFSALEYLKQRIVELLQQYKDNGDENQIEEVDDEHEGTDDNVHKNFVYATNENDSLRYSGEKETDENRKEGKKINGNNASNEEMQEQVEITEGENENGNINNENHNEEEEIEEQDYAENNEEQEENNNASNIQGDVECEEENEEPQENEKGIEGIDDEKKRREEEIHQLTENNQIDDDIEVDDIEHENDNHEKKEESIIKSNEVQIAHINEEVDKEDDEINENDNNNISNENHNYNENNDFEIEQHNQSPIEEVNSEKEEDNDKEEYIENQPKELDDDDYDEHYDNQPTGEKQPSLIEENEIKPKSKEIALPKKEEEIRSLEIKLPLKNKEPKIQTNISDNSTGNEMKTKPNNINSSNTIQLSSNNSNPPTQSKQTIKEQLFPKKQNLQPILQDAYLRELRQKESNRQSVDSSENANLNDKPPLLNEYLRPITSSSKKSTNNNRQQNIQTSQPSSLNHCPSTYTNVGNSNIFERLFKDAEMKRVVAKRPCHFSNRSSLNNINKPQPLNHRSNTPINQDGTTYHNYGEYLYKRELSNQQEKLKKNEEDKQKNVKKELEKCTFKPTLTEYNPTINTANGSKNHGPITYSVPSSYRPRTPVTRAEKMQKEFEETYTFKPKINNNYYFEMPFYQRQEMHLKKCKENIERNKTIVDNQQKEMRRKSKPKNENCNQSQLSAFDRNYNYANQYRAHKMELFNNYNINSPYFNPPVIKNQTSKIINKINTQAFINLFRELDSDEDNLISPLNINTKRTSQEILRIIQPLITELKEDQHILDESDFIEAMYNLYKEISYYDRHLLINTYKNKKNLPKKNYFNSVAPNNYKPKINTNATRLAKKYDNKVEKMFDTYLKTYTNNNGSNRMNMNNYNINRSEYFRSDPLRNLHSCGSNFTSITNVTFDNYLKNLN